MATLVPLPPNTEVGTPPPPVADSRPRGMAFAAARAPLPRNTVEGTVPQALVSPGVPAAQQGFAFDVYSGQMNPAAAGPIIAGAALTYTILKDIGGQFSSDITYTLEHLTGKVHPWDDASNDSKGKWAEKTIRIRAGVLETRVGSEQSAEFDVNYWYNGWSIGAITVSAAKANDEPTWELKVEQTIKPLPGAFSVDGKAVAGVRLEFIYKHTRPLSKAFYREEVTLYGAGKEHRKGWWTQYD